MPRGPGFTSFLATSAIHREHKLKMTTAQVIEKAVASVRRAKSYCEDVEFSPEDAARTEVDFLCEVVEAAIEAGRDDGEHPRHGRLRHAHPVCRRDPDPSRARA